ncbi:bifunctional DNA primase/polymerase [Trueperella pecoris]|uniref:Bifunctional DNA primase/polymerase n=1 Tax=Trueperella pecoris TaxID=2733571 RepID=A0A7M1R242_9ACTO|nr:phage/plasmid primase, P4 family [Trueperella pecoris]QOR47517.1 bifunctional DNA primase/polymerase [Trueperella pecoris]
MPILPADPQHGDKRPALSWKRLQTDRLTTSEVDQWFEDGRYGIGVIMGEISNDLMMIELEGRATHLLGELTQTATQSGLSGLWARMFGWCETTPSGGYHWYIYVPGNTSGNRKLARTLDGVVLAETRENGGYSVVAPLDGATYHHTGSGAWKTLTGSPTKAGLFTLDELDDLLAVFRTIDQTPEPATSQTTMPAYTPPAERDPHAGLTPGDDFEDKTSWADILTPHGWTQVFTRGQETFWRRPDKQAGVSASTGHAGDRDRLYVWSTSTRFEAETPYTKFAAYALLEHDGDYTKAAKHLSAKGYGKQAEHPRDTTGLDAYIQRLTNQPAVAGEPAEVVDLETGEILTVTEPDTYTRTDDGNALRFADTNTGKFRYVPEKSDWAVWNGHQWDIANGEARVMEAARALMRTLPEEEKIDQSHKRKSLQHGAITSMLKLARNAPGIYTPLPEFDADPYILNTPAGTVNLKTGKLTPPNPTTLCLRATTIAPDPTMPTPRWSAFLDQIFMNDTTLITYMRRFFGLTLIGEVTEQILPFFYGSGANGKTTMLNVIQNILGTGQTGYSTTTPAEILTNGDRHPAEIAALQGVRLAVISELEEGRRIAEARAKLLTGSDAITARFMGENWFTFQPTHTFTVLTNTMLETATGGSAAFWRRIRNIPFDYVVPKAERDPHLETKLIEEAPGILAWMIQGAQEYLSYGLGEPAAVSAATAKYEADQNTVGQFLREACTLHEYNLDIYQTRVNVFRDEYERWCRLNLATPVGAKALTQRLAKEGIKSVQGTKGARYYRGVSINPEFLESLDEVLS